MNDKLMQELKLSISNINSCLNGISKNYYKIGQSLYNIKTKYYIEQTKYKGYTSISDFAENEFGFESSKTSRLISIYEKFFLDRKYSPFEQFKYTHLTEMLSMTDQQIEMCKPEMTKNEIRQIKSLDLRQRNSQNSETIENNEKDNITTLNFIGNKMEKEEDKTTTIIVTELPQSPPKEHKTITIDVKTEAPVAEQNNNFVQKELQEEFYKKEYLKILDEKVQLEKQLNVLNNLRNNLQEKVETQQEIISYIANKLNVINKSIPNSEITKLHKEIFDFMLNKKLPDKVNFFKNVI